MRTGMRISVVVVVALMCAACLLAVACTDDASLKQPKPMDDYIAEVTDSVIAAVEKGTDGGIVGASVSGNMSVDGKAYVVAASLGFNAVAPGESVLSLFVTSGGETMIEVFADGSDMYSEIDLEFAPWLNGKVKYVNVGLFEYVASIFGVGGVAFKDTLNAFGAEVFSGVDVNADKTVYTFSLERDAFATIYQNISGILSALGGAVYNTISGIADIDADAVTTGSVSVTIKNGVSTRIESNDIRVGDVEIEFGLSLETDTSIAAKVAASVPRNDNSYRVSKIVDAYVSDKVSLLSESGAVARYDYTLNADLDAIVLALSGYDFSVLDDDNYFHLRVEHICSDSCGPYCAAKTRGGRGAIFEIAFSPEAFGTHNVYITADVPYLFSDDFIDDNADFIATSLSDYVMVVLTPEQLKGSGGLCALLLELCSGASSEVTLSVDDLLAGLGVPEQYRETFAEACFTGGYSQVQTLRFEGADGDHMQSMEYDIYKQFVWIVDDESSVLKDYEELFGLYGGSEAAMSWTAEPQAKLSDGNSISNIYNEGAYLIHGGVDGEYVPMSATEAASDDLWLKVDLTGVDGKVQEGVLVRIVGIEGLDASSTAYQKVKFKIEYPNAFSDSYIGSLFDGLHEMFVCSVDGVIRLTPEAEDGFVLTVGGSGSGYRIVSGSRTAPEYLTATATLTYQDGSTKTIRTEGTSPSVLKSSSIISTSYSVVDWGLIAVTYDVAGRQETRTVFIEIPTRSEFAIDAAAIPQVETGKTIYSAILTNHVKMYAYYGGDRVDVKLTAKDFYINDTPLSESTSEWKTTVTNPSSYTTETVFLRSNDYSMRVRKWGFVSDPFTVSVMPAQEMEVKYGFTDIVGGEGEIVSGDSVTLSSSIVNTRHGVSDGSKYTAEVTVTGPDGSDVTATAVTAYRVDNKSVDGYVAETELDEMLKNPVPVSITLVFNAPGTYEIRLYLRKAGSISSSSAAVRITVK